MDLVILVMGIKKDVESSGAFFKLTRSQTGRVHTIGKLTISHILKLLAVSHVVVLAC